MNIRVGFGYDVHKLVADRDLWLGGIKIDYELGLLGHSDADVLIHAICDALLGAANMRDIGYHFPDTAAETLNVDSKILLRKTMQLIATKAIHWAISMPQSVPNALNSTACASHESLSGRGDGGRRRPDIHQGNNHRETRIHRQNGGHLRLCHRSYPERIERNQHALKGQKLYIQQNVEKVSESC